MAATQIEAATRLERGSIQPAGGLGRTSIVLVTMGVCNRAANAVAIWLASCSEDEAGSENGAFMRRIAQKVRVTAMRAPAENRENASLRARLKTRLAPRVPGGDQES